jgi:glucokinase
MLYHIWNSSGATRSFLAKKLNVSGVSVGGDAEKLFNHEIIREGLPEHSPAGRRPVPLELNKELFYSFGLYIRRGWSVLTLLDAGSNKVEEAVFDDRFSNATEAFGFFCSEMERIRLKHGIASGDIIGAGVSVPGLLDVCKGTVTYSPSFRGDRGFKVVEFMEEKNGFPCCIMNDADLMALNEKWSGTAGDINDFLYFVFGYGLGIFLNGRLYLGHQGGAGEVGFMRLSSSGGHGFDGREGSLSGLKPYSGLCSIIEKTASAGGRTLVSEYLNAENPRVTFEMVLSAAERGDGFCRQVIADYFQTISDAVLNLAYLFNPQVIYLEPWTRRCPAESIQIVERKMGFYGVHNWNLSTEIVSASTGMEELGAGGGRLAVFSAFKKILKNQI